MRHQRGQRGGRVETAVQHDRGAQREGELEGGVPPGVEERRGDQHGVPGVQRDAVDDGHQRAEAVGSGPTGALGRAGGAGGEHDRPAVALGRLQVAAERAGDQLFEAALVHPVHLGGEAEDPVGELVVVDQHP